MKQLIKFHYIIPTTNNQQSSHTTQMTPLNQIDIGLRSSQSLAHRVYNHRTSIKISCHYEIYNKEPAWHLYRNIQTTTPAWYSP